MNNNFNFLAVDDIYQPLIDDECRGLQSLIQDFVGCYVQNSATPVEVWLPNKMSEHLPDIPKEEILEMSNEIIATLKVNEEKKRSLNEAIANGRSKENWFASDVKQATSVMSAQEASQYLANLDTALNNANEALYNTIITRSGNVSQNPHLDGFIAEQYHAQTFNMNAEAVGSSYRAKVLEPDGSGYGKNSVDIVIVDSEGKVARRYQSKYCKDADATVRAFEHGDYRGQQKLVPEGQEVDISKKCTTVIESPDGITSTPLSKSNAEQLRDEAQRGQWNDLNWNEYKTKDLAVGIGKQAGYAALQGAAIGVGFEVAQKLISGEEINGEELVETALVSGADFGVKAAAAGALKVGVERNIIKVIPKGTPATTIANIAYVGIENAKIIGKMATGELSFKEGVEKMEQTTISTVAGLAAMGKGTAIGASVGAFLGPIGATVGGFVGGTIGYIAGSKIGETIAKGAQKFREKAKEVVSSIGSGIKSVGQKVASGFKSFCSGFKSLFSR